MESSEKEPVFIFGPDSEGLYHGWTMAMAVDACTPVDPDTDEDLDYVGPASRVIAGVEGDGRVVLRDGDGSNVKTKQTLEGLGLPANWLRPPATLTVCVRAVVKGGILQDVEAIHPLPMTVEYEVLDMDIHENGDVES